MDLRECITCHIIKLIEEFPRHAKGKNGHRHTCKECTYAYMKHYRSIHRKQLHASYTAYFIAHKEELIQKKIKYRIEHVEEERTYSRQYRLLNPEKVAASQVAYRTTNREKIRQADRERYARNPEKHRSQAHAYRIQHPGDVKQSQKEYYDRNPEPRREASRQWYAKNRRHVKARSRAYRVSNPAIIKANKARYRARKYQAPINDLTAAQWSEIQAAQDHRCYYCGKRRKGKLTKDHIQALSKSGGHTLHNIIGACSSCNSRKGTKPPPIPVQPLLLTIAPTKKKRGT